MQPGLQTSSGKDGEGTSGRFRADHRQNRPRWSRVWALIAGAFVLARFQIADPEFSGAAFRRRLSSHASKPSQPPTRRSIACSTCCLYSATTSPGDFPCERQSVISRSRSLEDLRVRMVTGRTCARQAPGRELLPDLRESHDCPVIFEVSPLCEIMRLRVLARRARNEAQLREPPSVVPV